MNANTESSFNFGPADFSFVRGGPFYRVQQALGLIDPNHWNVGRRIIFLITLGWLPLPLITALWNPRGLPSFITEYRIHSRMLLAVPALLIGEIYMESRFPRSPDASPPVRPPRPPGSSLYG